MEPADAAPKAANPWAHDAVRIVSRRRETDDIVTYGMQFVDPRRGERFTFQPGQFNMLYLPGAGEAAISLSGHEVATRTLLHTVRRVGNVTTALERLPVGGMLGLRGPFGQGWPVAAARGGDALLVAGGLGLPPLRPALEAILAEREAFGEVGLIYGARSPDGLLFLEEIETWRKQGVRVELTVDRPDAGWSGHVGVVTPLVDGWPIARPDRTTLFTCGPEVMMHFVARAALARGLAAERLFLSVERNMNCAIGLCGHCQFGPEFICKDGPVLSYERLAPFLRIEAL